ncbi:MAG: D-glycerate dehydrogenase [candidate division Zixibacteria bacterium]|nr:D-glycerate dehydrogenase [candidate division Zixibacteria bacterium]MBU1471230.1 D-glycerate dehydrogenase [candidate division Zixibacteria bacterium]MBU2624932.1 D-glycerate dehydrogenase [candidate division Zixibacteria bacterium]
MSKPKVYITRLIPESGMNMILDACDAEVWSDDRAVPREILEEKIRGADGVLSLLSDRIDAPLMDIAGPQLKVISNYAVGFDNVDLAAATERGILVCNTPDVLTETTADLAFALLLAAARRLNEGVDFVRGGKWKTWGPMLLLGHDVHRATLGLIGMGRIGGAVARRASGFSMNVICYDPHASQENIESAGARRIETFDALLAESDFISIHVPLTSETDKLIDASAFRKMKRTAILINTARGQVVDTDALYDALRDGEIAYAALDVCDPEPVPPDHKLLTLDNCIIVPHIGSATVATRDRMSVMAAESLLAGLRGELPRYALNPEALAR